MASFASSSSATAMDADSLSEAQAQRYDRQVRVWGAEAQLRIQQAKVLLIGFKGIQVEAAKNLVLAGVSVVIYEPNAVQESDLSYNFFLSHSDIGQNIAQASAQRLQQLNPFSSVVVETKSVLQLEKSYFDQFSVVLAGDCREADVININNYFRSLGSGKALFWSGGFGMDAWFISDFGDSFSYKDDPPKNKDTVTISFPSIAKIVEKPWSAVNSKKFPLSPIFVKFRILETYRNQYGRLPTSSDLSTLVTVAKETLSRNDIPVSHLDTDGSSMDICNNSNNNGNSKAPLSPIELCSLDDLKFLCCLSKPDGSSSDICVLPCSVLGSFLSQEIIKAVSWTGEPALNTFIYNGSQCEAKCIPIV
jgi:ubiquitin-like 1-activating enzyme E1 A